MLQHKMLPPKQSKLQVPGADNSSGLDNKPASLLSFEGARQVHGIYNWILDSTLSLAADALDVPQLLSPSPFLGASIHKLEPQVLPIFSKLPLTYISLRASC